MSDEKIQLSIKLDKALVEKIDKSALEEKRNRTLQIAYIIQRYYDLVEKK